MSFEDEIHPSNEGTEQLFLTTTHRHIYHHILLHVEMSFIILNAEI